MEKKKSNDFFVMLIVVLFGFVLGYVVGAFVLDHAVGNVTEEKQTTITKWDTVYIASPVANDSTTTDYIVRWLPTAKEKREGSAEHHQELVVNDTSPDKVFQPPNDSAAVIIPIVQKKYEGDEYTAWVSGYERHLDSINLFRRTDIVTKTLYIEKKRRRWGCVVGVGAGVNVKGEVQPTLGVTFGYRLF